MLKRKPVELHINHERWLVSYADFVTLLFAFFVVMYSVSHVNEVKYEALSNTLSELFDQKKEPDERSSKTESEAATRPLVPLQRLENSVYEKLSVLIDSGDINVVSNAYWLEISLNNHILFAPGSVRPSQQAQEVMAKIAEVLRDTNNPINVEGYTDDTAISTEQFPSNWQLSAARAAAIVQLLIANRVAPDQLAAIGYGEFKPIASNATEAGRAKNRRVSLMINQYQQQRPDITQPSTELENNRNSLSADTVNTKVDGSITTLQDQLSTQTSEVIPITLENGELLFTSDPEVER